MIETIEIGNAKDDQLTVTLRGEPAKIVHALVHGLSREALQQINDALTEELTRRKSAAVRPEGLAADVPRLLELCAEFNVQDADDLKHRLEDYRHWRWQKLHAAVRPED